MLIIHCRLGQLVKYYKAIVINDIFDQLIISIACQRLPITFKRYCYCHTNNITTDDLFERRLWFLHQLFFLQGFPTAPQPNAIYGWQPGGFTALVDLRAV